uniref:nucleoside-diphosphate kinase n=1 Tax=Panthera leo TaxID=9689 RepID=A0A8C8Y8C0_PANLE
FVGLFTRLLLGVQSNPRAPGPWPNPLSRPSSGGPSCTWKQPRVAVTPDGVSWWLLGGATRHFEGRSFILVGAKMLQVPERPHRALPGPAGEALPPSCPITNREDFGVRISRNVIHTSDSVEGAQRDSQLWFQGCELVDWKTTSLSTFHPTPAQRG